MMSFKYPTNEQETILRFHNLCEELGVEIQNIWNVYPDATVLYKGYLYKVEFEYKLSNFIKHKHDPSKCDLVVCWINDIPEVAFPLTVWTVSDNNYPNIQHIGKSITDRFYMEYIKKPKKIGRPAVYGTGKLFDTFMRKLRGEHYDE
jgi:hypothetical protein